MTASDIHKKLHEISSKYLSGKPLIYVDDLLNEFNISRERLDSHLNDLKNLGLIEIEKDLVRLTDSGLKAKLP